MMLLSPASYYYKTSFNYGGNKARDVGLTRRYHLSNIISDTLFFAIAR